VRGERQAAGDQSPAEQACGSARLKEREDVHVALAGMAGADRTATRNGKERRRRSRPMVIAAERAAPCIFDAAGHAASDGGRVPRAGLTPR
jgi:hypothetical protein